MKQAELTKLKELVNAIVPEPEAKKKVVLSRFSPVKKTGGYTIERTQRQVIFGCGAVKVNKSDLLIVAEYLELQAKYPKAMERLVAGWSKHDRFTSSENIINIGAKKLRQIAG